MTTEMPANFRKNIELTNHLLHRTDSEERGIGAMRNTGHVGDGRIWLAMTGDVSGPCD
jgi:hypothetical protein